MTEDVVLVPFKMEDRSRSLRLTQEQWRTAIKLVAQQGYRPNVFAGLDRFSARPFANHLAKALETNVLNAEPSALSSLCGFLRGVGAGGFTIEKRW